MSDDDPVVSEHDVFISTQLSSYLHVIQYPGNVSELERETTATTGRFKKNHTQLELEFPLDMSHPTYSSERGAELAAASQMGRITLQDSYESAANARGLSSLKLSGTKIPLSANSKYFVAVSTNNSIHMTPVETFIAMKPALTYLDESDAKTKNTAKKLETDNSAVQDKLKVVQVQFKKRETEEQIAARLSSYAYLQRQVEEEPWTGLTHFLPRTAECSTVAARLTASSTLPINFKPGH
jgi:transcriptional regulator with GAF, ATPase, and Fis domain